MDNREFLEIHTYAMNFRTREVKKLTSEYTIEQKP